MTSKATGNGGCAALAGEREKAAGTREAPKPEAAQAASQAYSDDDNRLALDALATAWLQFTALANELPACPHRDALRLAADIADALATLRTGVSDIVINIESRDNFTAVDAARKLRWALDEAVNGRA